MTVTSYEVASWLAIPISIYILNRYLEIFFDKHTLKSKKWLLVCYAIREIGGTLLFTFLPYPVLNMPFSIITLYLCCNCYEASISKKISITAMVYGIYGIIECIVGFLTGIRTFSFLSETNNGNVFIFIALRLIEWLVSLLLARFKHIKKTRNLPKIFMISMVLIPVGTLIQSIGIVVSDSFSEGFVAAVLIIVMVVDFMMMYLYDSLGRMFEENLEKELADQEKKYYYHQAEILEENYEEMRKFRHDMKNKLITIQQLVENGKIEEAKEYLAELEGKLTGLKAFSSSGYTVVDSVINYKLSKAQTEGIRVEANVKLPKELVFHTDDLVIVLGNLLDNAIEAAKKAEGDKYILLNFFFYRGVIELEIKNSFNGQVRKTENGFETLKDRKEFHGIGLKSVKYVVDKYAGDIHFSYTDNEFVVKIELYQKLKNVEERRKIIAK